jgi:hypothetical protein
MGSPAFKHARPRFGDAIHGNGASAGPDRPTLRGAAIVPDVMKTAMALTLALAAMPLAAETVVIDGQVGVRAVSVELPPRGINMARVEERFGAPKVRHAAVGQPPITRWDYEGFSVYFEHQHVVHAVAHGG